MNAFFKAILFSALVIFSLPAGAQESSNLVKIRLLPERATIKPGEDLTIGIEETIAPGWHTYWKNPGDSGTPPRVTWALPGGLTAGPIEWPAPNKLPQGPLTNYGYETKTTLLQKIAVPADFTEDGPVTLTANVEILVCKEECIPEQGSYAVTLNDPAHAPDLLPTAAAQAISAPAPFDVSYTESDGDLVLTMRAADIGTADPKSLEFFPADWGLVKNAAKPAISIDKDLLIFRQKRDQRSLSSFTDVNGVLKSGGKSYEISARKVGASAAASTSPAALSLQQMPIWQALLFAILGGLILNLMPCVFPVLSIKALSLVKISEKHPKLARLHGLAYSSGVILSFVAIALLLIVLRAYGSEIGWGFQLQNPIVVTLLAWLLFVIGLNFAGLYEVSGHLGNVGAKLAAGEGVRNSFFTGILATLVAAPCTAPFMGVAVGVALLQPPAISLTIFAALGLGLALPYAALSFIPALRSKLPKPGAWMEVFKELLAFPMFASSAWLIWVLSQQQGSMGVFGALMGLVFIAMGIWLLGHTPKTRYWRYKVRALAIASFIFAFCLLPASQMNDAKETGAASGFGEAWSPEKLDAELKTNDPVFVEMTAAWCITCKVNHAVAIDRDATRALFANRHIHYLIGDWTSQDARITEYLNGFGRNGVPLYIYYGPKDSSGKRPTRAFCRKF